MTTVRVSPPHHGRTAALNRMKRAGLASQLIIVPACSREPTGPQISLVAPSAQGEKIDSWQQILRHQLLIDLLREPAGKPRSGPPRPAPISRYASILMQRRRLIRALGATPRHSPTGTAAVLPGSERRASADARVHRFRLRSLRPRRRQ